MKITRRRALYGLAALPLASRLSLSAGWGQVACIHAGQRSAAAAVSPAPGEELDERSQRAYLLEGQVSPLLPIQPERGGVG